MQLLTNNRNPHLSFPPAPAAGPVRKEVVLRRMDGTTYVTIHYNPSTNRVVSDWQGYYATPANFKNGLLAEVRMIEETKATTWLADLSDIKTSIKDHMQWIAETVSPLAVAAGVKAEAVVLPQSRFIKHETEATVNAIVQAGSLTIKFFSSRSEAQAWLDAQAA